MSRRQSINIAGFDHGPQPIPAACRVDNIVATGGIYGLDPRTGTIPDAIAEQTTLMFANLEAILAAAGSGLDEIVKMTIWVKNPAARQALNDQWLLAFPDSASRPARHTIQNDYLPANMLIQCDALAVSHS
jgi:2-iminobutanoate/2-iminopropanoate deaminase